MARSFVILTAFALAALAAPAASIAQASPDAPDQAPQTEASSEQPNLPTISELLEAVDKASANDDQQKDWSTPVKLAVVFAGLALLPSLLVMVTSFTRIVIVLSFVRRALSTQSIPPTMAIIGLALFLTVFTMSPTFGKINELALQPYLAEEMTFSQACTIATDQIKGFMVRQTRQADLGLFMEMSDAETAPETLADIPTYVAIPAFAISEFRTAFEMGCLLFIPFVLVDLVISGILLSAGMMMLPPMMISLPFKLVLFVLVDGWAMLTRTLVTSFQ